MNDSILVKELIHRLKTTGDPALFDTLFLLYVYRYRQVLQNTVYFTVRESDRRDLPGPLR
ncbi:hypothetical protein [Larkinella soli]|uniref:hypothetical protein n=1 Tax=Larkinella soli TaxID=1770527 RepID=UPI000FFB9686|nr:hypothetical protein [Larkinella soli]